MPKIYFSPLPYPRKTKIVNKVYKENISFLMAFNGTGIDMNFEHEYAKDI